MTDAIRPSSEPRLQGRQVRGRLPVLRRLDRTERDGRISQVRGKRERLRAREATRGGDRPVQLAVRDRRSRSSTVPREGRWRSSAWPANTLARPAGGRLSIRGYNLRGAPNVYYPTGVRNFLRLVAREDQQGVAEAELAEQLGLRSVYLLYDPMVSGAALWTEPFRRVASKSGPGRGLRPLRCQRRRLPSLAERVARARADGVLIGGQASAGGDKLLRALRARRGARATIMAAEGFTPIPEVLERAGRAAHGLYVTTPALPPDGST